MLQGNSGRVFSNRNLRTRCSQNHPSEISSGKELNLSALGSSQIRDSPPFPQVEFPHSNNHRAWPEHIQSREFQVGTCCIQHTGSLHLSTEKKVLPTEKKLPKQQQDLLNHFSSFRKTCGAMETWSLSSRNTYQPSRGCENFCFLALYLISHRAACPGT